MCNIYVCECMYTHTYINLYINIYKESEHTLDAWRRWSDPSGARVTGSWELGPHPNLTGEQQALLASEAAPQPPVPFSAEVFLWSAFLALCFLSLFLRTVAPYNVQPPDFWVPREWGLRCSHLHVLPTSLRQSEQSPHSRNPLYWIIRLLLLLSGCFLTLKLPWSLAGFWPLPPPIFYNDIEKKIPQ